MSVSWPPVVSSGFFKERYQLRFKRRAHTEKMLGQGEDAEEDKEQLRTQQLPPAASFFPTPHKGALGQLASASGNRDPWRAEAPALAPGSRRKLLPSWHGHSQVSPGPHKSAGEQKT